MHIEDEVSLVSEFKVDPNNPDNAAFNRFNDALLERYSGAGRRYVWADIYIIFSVAKYLH